MLKNSKTRYCSICGAKIEKNKEICPYCGSEQKKPSFFDVVKNSNFTKTPFYKRKLFILIIVIIVLFTISGLKGIFTPKISDNFTLGEKKTVRSLEFKIPKGWKKNKEYCSENILRYDTFKDNNWLGYYMVIYGGKSADFDIERVKADAKQIFSLKNSTAKISNISEENIKGTDAAYTATCKYNDGKMDLEVHLCSVLVDKTVFYFLLGGKPENIDNKALKTLVASADFESYTNDTKLLSIKAKYKGSTKKGVYIDNNADIEVTGKYSDGYELNITGWKIKNPSELKAGKESTYKLVYENQVRIIKIMCTSMTTGQEQAYDAATQYLDTMAFSKAGLIAQLSSKYGSGFNKTDAEFAVKLLEKKKEVNWKEQAYRAAKEYLKTMSFSKSGLIEQLESSFGSKFTHEEAVYGANKAYE